MTLTCEQCGNPFERPSARGTVPKFCKHACRSAAFRKRAKVASPGTHRLLNWILDERDALWREFAEAARRAIKAPVPGERRTWSIEMENIADRIRGASGLLGHPSPPESVLWVTYPYYEQIEGVPVSEDAWNWLRKYISKSPQAVGAALATWALQYAPPPKETT